MWHRSFALLITAVFLLLSLVVPIAAQDQEGPLPVGLRQDAPEYALHGPNWVGTRDYLVGEGEDLFGITVWYPALNPEGNPEEVTYYVSKEYLSWMGFPEDTEFPIIGHALASAVPDAANGPYPLVVFSPGLSTWRQASVYLLEHLASEGFVVISLEFRGEAIGGEFWQGAYTRPIQVQSAIQYADQLTADGGELAGVINVDKLAVIGASSGGWTALMAGGAQMDLGGCPVNPGEPEGLVWFSDCISFLPKQDEIAALFGYESTPEGLWPQQYDPRVDAVISIVPDGDIWGAQYQGVASLMVPTMIVASSDDTVNIPIHAAYPIYEHLGSADKSLVLFNGADHPVSHDSCETEPWLVDEFYLYWMCADAVWDKDRAHDLVNHFTTAFLFDVFNNDAKAHSALLAENVSFPGITYETTLK